MVRNGSATVHESTPPFLLHFPGLFRGLLLKRSYYANFLIHTSYFGGFQWNRFTYFNVQKTLLFSYGVLLQNAFTHCVSNVLF